MRRFIFTVLAATFLVYGVGKTPGIFWPCMALSLIFDLIALGGSEDDEK